MWIRDPKLHHASAGEIGSIVDTPKIPKHKGVRGSRIGTLNVVKV